MISNAKISNIKVSGLDFRDAPDFCDAFIESADIDGREATEEEIDICGLSMTEYLEALNQATNGELVWNALGGES